MAEQDRVTYTSNDGSSYELPTGETRGGIGFRKWRTCDICGMDWPMDKTVQFRGRDYGIPCGCSKDIRDILRKEHAGYRHKTEEQGDYDD